MSTRIFIERSRLGKVFFEVKQEFIRVSGRRAMESFSVEAEFHAMSPRIERLNRRFYRPIIFGLGLGALFAAITAGFVFQTKVVFGAVIYFVEFSGLFAVAFLIAGFRWLPRLEVVRFKDVVGRTVFDVVKEKAYAAEFEDFIEDLQDRIRRSKTPSSDGDAVENPNDPRP